METHVTKLRHQFSPVLRPVIDCSNDRDRTEQHHRDDTDTAAILRKFGVTGVPPRQIIFDETDYDIDLQTAISAVDKARQIYRVIPDDVRKEYPTITHLFNAMQRGTLIIKRREEKPVSPPTPSTTTT